MEITYRRNLYKLLQHYELPHIVAEIRVAEGLFSRDMLEWGIELLFCVDNWGHIPGTKGDGNNPTEWHERNRQQAMERLKPWDEKDKVIYLQGFSREMCQRVNDGILGLLYLDGDHSYDGVMQDLKSWYEKVAPGGIIAGHDFINANYGVADAVQDFCGERLKIHLINEDKPEDAGFWFQKI